MGRRISSVATVPVGLSGPGWPIVSGAVAAVLVTGAVAWSYAPNFAWLAGWWERDPNYSYGFLVVPIALAILWNRRLLLDRDRMEPRWWGFAPLLALLGLRVLLYARNEQYAEAASLPAVLASLALALGGTHLVRVSWPALVFLFFMLPLPPSVNTILAGPLQRLATLGSVSVLQLTGLPVLAEGNVIVVGAERLEVAQACNGLSMLLSFVALIAALVILVPRPPWERLVLMASAIPIALVTNVIRIVATAWCYHRFGHEDGEKMTHDIAGLAMPMFALALAFLELRLLSWVVIEERPAAPNRGVRVAR